MGLLFFINHNRKINKNITRLLILNISKKKYVINNLK
jgi:hypothetical protein